MKFIHSFRTRLFTGFLAASLVPVLVCSSMLLQIFRLRLDSQVDEESQEYLSQVTESLDGLYTGFRQTMLALRASPYVAPALAREQTKSSRVYSELYSATEGSRSGAQFDLYDSQGTWLYSTRSVPPGTRLPTQWGVLYAARQTDDLVFSQVDGGEGNTAVLLRGAAQIPLTSGQEAGYLVITMTRADFHQLLDGKYGSRNDLLLLNRYWRPVYSSKTSLAASVAPQLRQQLLDGEPLRLEGEEYAYRAAVQEEMGLYAVLQHPQAMNQSTRGLLTTVTASSVLVCVVMSVLMCLRLSRQMFLPIQRLHSAISEVVQNNLDVYIPPYQDDELGQLAQRFNGMVAALKHNQEQLVENQRELNEAQIRMLQPNSTLISLQYTGHYEVDQQNQPGAPGGGDVHRPCGHSSLLHLPRRVCAAAPGGRDPAALYGNPVHPPVRTVQVRGGASPGPGGVHGAQDDPPAHCGKRRSSRSGGHGKRRGAGGCTLR